MKHVKVYHSTQSITTKQRGQRLVAMFCKRSQWKRADCVTRQAILSLRIQPACLSLCAAQHQSTRNNLHRPKGKEPPCQNQSKSYNLFKRTKKIGFEPATSGNNGPSHTHSSNARSSTAHRVLPELMRGPHSQGGAMGALNTRLQCWALSSLPRAFVPPPHRPVLPAPVTT